MHDVATPSASREAGTPMSGPDPGVWPSGLALRSGPRLFEALAPVVSPALSSARASAQSDVPAAQRKALRIVAHDKERRHLDPKFASGTVPSDLPAAGIDAASMARRCQTPFKNGSGLS